MLKENFIELINNYTFTTDEINNSDIINIQNISWKNVKQKNKLIIRINFNDLNKENYKKILKKLYKIKNKVQRNNIQIGYTSNNKIVLGCLLNYDNNDNKQQDLIAAICCILYDTKKEMYNYIYDYVCNYLDNQFYKNNLCNFKNNRCEAKSNTDCIVGCCRHPKYKKIGLLLPTNKFITCEYLKNKKCTAKCISCKLFTCDYLEKKGIKFRLKDILLLDTFFNPIQKYFIKFKVFTPKERILKLLFYFSL